MTMPRIVPPDRIACAVACVPPAGGGVSVMVGTVE
jgi:hypothetical protein